MKSLINLIKKTTFISITTALFFIYIIFLIVYGLVNPPEIGSAHWMIVEMLLILSFIPLGLFVIDRLLVRKINYIKLTIIETILFGSIFLYYFLVVNPF